MDEQDILTSIKAEIDAYCYKNHEVPAKIFMTYALLVRIMNEVVRSEEGTTLFGIPVEPYHSEELEYYLVGSCGRFRKWS